MADVLTIINEPITVSIYQGSDWTEISYGSNPEVSGLQFISLSDVPHSYSGQAGNTPVVNPEETGLIFKSIVASKFTSLSDCPPSYKNAENKFVRVNSTGTGLQFANIAKDGVVKDFIELADVPSSYAGASNDVVQVTQSENGLTFTPILQVLPDVDAAQGTYPNATVTIDSKGRVTEISAGTTGTVLPEFTANKLLIGNGTNIPQSFDNSSDNRVLTSNSPTSGVENAPTWNYVGTLRSPSGVLVVNTSSLNTLVNLQVNADSSGITIYPTNTTAQDLNLNLQPSGTGTVVLGSQTGSVKSLSNLNMTDKKIVGLVDLVLQPNGLGVLKVDSTNLANPTYREAIQNKNDIPNKDYVDFQIEKAISEIAGKKSLKASDPQTMLFTDTEVLLDNVQVNAYIEEVRVIVTSEFSGGDPFIVVGNDTNNQLVSDAIKFRKKGVYQINTFCPINLATPIKAYMNSVDCTSGSLQIYIKYFV